MLYRFSRSTFYSSLRAFLAFFVCVLAALSFVGIPAESAPDQPLAILDQISTDNIWQEVEAANVVEQGEREIVPQAYRTLHLNKPALDLVLRQAPLEFTDAARKVEVVMPLPLPDGKTARFRIEESPIMEPGLAAKFPEIKTYHGQGIDDPTATIRFDVTPMGFHAQVLSAQETVYVDPYAKGDTENYISYFKSNVRKDSAYECLVEAEKGAGVSLADAQLAGSLILSPLVSPLLSPNGTTLRTYRLALGATGEYTIAAGGTVPLAMARMTTSMNRVNGLYERELALRMTLVANNNLLIYTDPATDEYTNNDGFAMMGQHQTKADNLIGSANYDMGHVFSTGGGGTARIRSTCNPTFKGQGVTGLPSPVGDPFDVDFVAHEMGHQHGGLHTFNTTTGVCNGFRTIISAFEPGSGSTPMSYVGTCAPNNLQANSHDYFHVRSLEEMVTYMTGGGNCAAQSATGNTPPTVNAGANFTIPRNTPFALTASATDTNGDALTYAWEEYDLGPVAPPEGDADGMARPIFRTYQPTTNPTRIFPSLQYILNNANVPPATYACGQPSPCITGESLPNITRTMNFQVTARDNRAGGGGIVSAQMQVNVNAAAGPFVVTQPNTAVSWTGFTQQNVLWDVAGTTAAPISAASVNILLSTDGGNTFPIILAAATANDGTESITVPNLTTTTARIKVEAAGNIFFDISGANFSIAAVQVPDVSIAVSPSSTSEDGPTNLVYTLTRSSDNSAPLTVNFSVSGTATFNTDYSQTGATTFTSSSGTATFGASSSTSTVTIDPTADTAVEANETAILTVTSGTGYNVGSPSIATATITNDDTPTLNYSLANYVVSESAGFVNVNVTRSGDPSTAVAVDYTTSDNSGVIPDEAQAVALCGTVNSVALSKCDFNTALGTLRFASGETTKSFTVLLTQDSYVEGTEFAPLTLSNPTNGAVLGTQSAAMLEITDDATEPSTNAIDDARNFVRQHYHDFLNREPDQAGWDFWTDNITKCNDPARRPPGQTLEQCLDKQRETTSGAFFLSPEFQYTGSYICGVYKGSLDRRPTFLEFMRDLPQLVNGIIVAGAISGPVIEANRAQYLTEFVQRAEFLSIYGALNNQAYVDKLFLTTGTSVSSADRQALVTGLNGGTETRATVLHKVVNGTRVISESQVEVIATYGKAFFDTQFNPSFVQMEYFGYMRRNEDTAGFNFWLGKLNFYGDFITAEMVRSFLLSPEYRRRFGSQ